ncbi:MAG: hypothetical protein QG618_2491, partial [Thermodesulfobacteriota bacterium]|nr:hypothetical protein [Thermodesulfobacteriota bacterium]
LHVGKIYSWVSFSSAVFRAVVMVFMLYYTIADSVQQKKIFNLGNWFSYCHGSNRNSLCLFSDAGGI